jgi:addiction module RelE/StbE family toxin
MQIKEVKELESFSQNIKRLDNSLLDKLYKQIEKIILNPEVGKPLRYDMKGERTIYVKPYRLIYKVEGETLFLLQFSHRKSVYR